MRCETPMLSESLVTRHNLGRGREKSLLAWKTTKAPSPGLCFPWMEGAVRSEAGFFAFLWMGSAKCGAENGLWPR